jgi:hypothetical protein
MGLLVKAPLPSEAMPPEDGEAQPPANYLTVFGKPEAYRTVLRQSR